MSLPAISLPRISLPQRRKKPPRSRRWRGWLWLKLAGALCLVLLLAGGGYVAYCVRDLPGLERLAAPVRQPSIRLLDSDGNTFSTVGDLFGERIDAAELPEHVRDAVLAIEDRRFYEHWGIDWRGILRAAVANALAGRVVQGGSTITQQLAKNAFLTPARTIERKVQEMVLAFRLEYEFSKDEILTRYLNRVYLGAGAYGIDAAARRYFGKPVGEINVMEAAVLAGLLRAPSRDSPASDPARALARGKVVLEAMEEAGTLSPAEAERAAGIQIAFAEPPIAPGDARYFADYVLGLLEDLVTLSGDDLVVHTTLDLEMQRIAEARVEAILAENAEARDVSQAALLSMSVDGAIRAMVGGRDYQASQFNRTTQARRQPGSSFKAFVYLAGFESGLHPAHRFEDAPITVGNWSPSNYGEKYHGFVSLREAFARSLNSISVRVGERIGAAKVAEVAHRLGVTMDGTVDLSITLGAMETTVLDMTTAYGAFVNYGDRVTSYAIDEISLPDGTPLYKPAAPAAEQVIDERNLSLMNELLRSVVTSGTGRRASLGDHFAAGKTGTSQESRDAWFVGYSPELVTGVWMGNDDNHPTKSVTGGNLPAMLWQVFMSRAVELVPAGEPPQIVRHELETLFVDNRPEMVQPQPIVTTPARAEPSQAPRPAISATPRPAAPPANNWERQMEEMR